MPQCGQEKFSCATCEDTLIPVETMEADLAESLGHHYTGQEGEGGWVGTRLHTDISYLHSKQYHGGGVTGAHIKGMTV